MGRFEETFPALARLRPVDRAIVVWALLHISLIINWNSIVTALHVLAEPGLLPFVVYPPQLFYFHMAVVALSAACVVSLRSTVKLMGYIAAGLAILIELYCALYLEFFFVVLGGTDYMLPAMKWFVPAVEAGLLVWVIFGIFDLSRRRGRDDAA